ncbi:hypothetical protein J1907_15530 [Lysinibacillus sphaericus]|uniref:hypothetical protein n=1 Tax=Lysinibacillus sphaericus TaxID=1421 RepID=UPI0018AFC2C3|nr:hypothetical protein [Lysinibacillus sphaericus]QPA57529.1 hypothetical protein INQ55_15235 [Lysinibacillus sphaericus]QTB21174.1 hypothetical protein J1907_15530 [Lysinibacillus sphaericus]
MTNNQINECEPLELLTEDQRVPKDYLVRKLEAAIDFSFIFLTNCPCRRWMLTFAAMN